jgi:hypothetical protein
MIINRRAFLASLIAVTVVPTLARQTIPYQFPVGTLLSRTHPASPWILAKSLHDPYLGVWDGHQVVTSGPVRIRFTS